MPCPASPEPDGFHRFKLKPSGKSYVSACIHCGEERTYRPYEEPAKRTTTAAQQQGATVNNATKRREV